MGYILVVDDEKELADVIELYLANDGYNDMLPIRQTAKQ